MGKQRAPLEFNRLTGGIITEASPLTFPDSASLDEVNFELRTDGTRRRRYGFDLEANYVDKVVNSYYDLGTPEVVSTFLWENVSGRNDIAYVVVQVDRSIYFYKANDESLSSGIIDFTVDVTATTFNNRPYDFASIDGTLVITTGDTDILTIHADLSDTEYPILSKSTGRLTTRDLFGVPVWYDRSVETGGLAADLIDLTDPYYYSKRPVGTGLPSAEEEGAIDYVSGEYDVGTREIRSDEFTPSTFEGYGIDYFLATNNSGDCDMYLKFNNTTTNFQSLSFYCNILGAQFIMNRKSSSSRTYETSLTEDQYELLEAATESNFTLISSTSGNIHNYNLRNQTFAASRLPKEGTESGDPISSFVDEAGAYPSMSDTVLSALYPNVEDDDNKTADRFHAEDLVENPLGTAPAPKGYFIIDALERSTSRYTRWEELVADEGYSDIELTELPTDITPGGATTIVEYGGRLWYGGFSELGTATEDGGTRLETYLLYSQLANNSNVLTRCYQTGDPTSSTDPDLLDTDGGFLSLDGAYGISKMVTVGTSLLIFAENGVWAISGLDGNYFTPTSPRVEKITDKGCISANSIVVVDTSILYWAKTGIYAVQYSTAGTYEVDNLVEKTIQTLYDEIPYTDKQNVDGTYDSYSNEIYWIVYNTVAREQETEILTLKTGTGAFTKYKIEESEEGTATLAAYAKIPDYTLRSIDEEVTVEGETVVIDITDTITTPVTLVEERQFDTKGVVIHEVDGGTNITFGEFNNSDFKDWGYADAEAYIVTGYTSGGDLQRVKQIPYITLHFTRTEDGFFADENGDLQLNHPSGCFVQAQWDWANSANSGRWGREFQAYRYPRHYMPADVNDPFDTGFATITTRNKIRGKGRVMSLKLRSEEGKDCRVLGWSAIMGVQDGL